jgi:TetR/AcrR family transcriptional repressor of nem operon
LQERGFDGAGVAEISRAAGLTQGALYGQFKSKDALAAEAIRTSFLEGALVWLDLLKTSPDAISTFLDTYLCEDHAKDPGAGCTLAACVSEIGRQDRSIVAAYADGFRQLAEIVQQAFPAATPPEEARRRAVALLSGVVGALALARALEKADPDLSRQILLASREQLERLAVADSPAREPAAPSADPS